MVERKSCLPESTEIPSAEHSKTQQHVASQTPAEDQGAVVPVDGAQLHFAPNDAAEMQPGGSVVEKTSAAVSPHTAKPLVTYLRNAQHRHPSQTEREATPAAVATPLSSLLAKAVPRRHGKNSKVWRELTVSSSEFDFPSELPLPKLSSRRDQRDSQSGTRGKEHNAGANNSKTPAVRTEVSSHEKASFTFDGKLQKHARQKSGAEEVTPNEPGRVRDNVKLPKAANVVTPAWFDVPSDACPPPPVQDQTMNLAESRKVKSEEALFPPSDREDGIVRSSIVHSSQSELSHARDSQLPGKSSGTGTTRPRYPEVFSSYSSESLRKLASSRERRGALAPTHDQLQNLYKTLMMAQHPPRRERLSREAFSKKFFIPKGTKIDFPPPGLPGHPAGSSSSMARMKDKNPGSGESCLKEVASSRTKRAIATACVVLAIVGTMLVAFYAFHSTPPAGWPRALLCVTDDCRLHALYLDYNINDAFSPCTDFNGHVCSRWMPSQTYAELGATALGELTIKWIENLPSLLRRVAEADKTAERPLLMYESCVKERDHASLLDAAMFVAFLKELNLSWPEKSPSQVSALEVLIDLALRWQMTFWLSFQLRKDASQGARLYIETGDADVLSLFAMNHRYVMQRGSYIDYWMSHYTALYGNATSVPAMSHIRESAVQQTYIIKLLTDVRTKNAKSTTVLPIGQVSNHKSRITSSEWLRHLKKYPSGEAFQSYPDQVFSDASLLDAINLLFNTYDDKQLIHHFSWQFVQMYFLVLERTPLEIVHWGKTYSAAYVPVYCAMYVEEVYRPLLAAVSIELTISSSDISRLNYALGSLMDKVVSALNASQLDAGAKRLALSRYQSMQVRIWPPGRYYGEDEIENAYYCCPRKSGSFTRHWIECHRCLQRVANTPFHRESSGMHRLLSSSPVTYDPVANELSVAVSALGHPLYYPHGTPAMFYGGLGFLFVAEMLKALSRAHVAVLVRASATTDVPVGNRSDGRCFAVRENDTRATYFAALNVAYAAFAEDTASDVQDRRRPISRRRSEESVFFLTACRMMCRVVGSQPTGSIDCNSLFRNSPHFAKAFSCPRESAMNPSRRCVYFGDNDDHTS